MPPEKITKQAAAELLAKEGFLFGSLPTELQTPELRDLCNNWWRDHLYNTIMYYRDHPEEIEALKKQAQGREGSSEPTIDIE
jgi:hypothetical protein